MQKTNTVSDIFNIAISLEKKAGDFYLDLSSKFPDHPEVSEFWKGMMDDERQHARILQKMLASLSEEQRLTPVDVADTNYSDDELRRYLSLCDLQNIKNLDDAYDIAYKLESSEINAKVTALTKKFTKSEEMINFILYVLDKHISKFEEFYKSFGDEKIRRNILAKTD